MGIAETLHGDHPAVEFYLTRRGDYVELNKLIVDEGVRGQGAGTRFMNDLVNEADRRDLVLATTPSTDFGATSRERLEGFYRQFGFVENAGQQRDYRTKETMYRVPGGGSW